MIHLVLCSNENYADGMLVTVASALSSLNREASITVHLLDGGISEKTFRKLEKICKSIHQSCNLDIIKIQEECFQGFTPGPGNSLMTYARLLMGSFLRDVDRVIYIDVDFLVLKDLQELWNRDMEGKIAWACKDIGIPYLDGETPLPVSEEEKKWPYFNAGFLMIDLKKWRDTNIEGKSLELGLINKSDLADQPILNYLFRGDVGFLDNEWNWQSPNVLLEGRVRIANYHFLWVKKPWMHFRTPLNYRLWRYYYRKYACGEISSLYRKIGLKRLFIGIRESLIRSSPFLHTVYLKSVARKLGVASPEYSGIRDYYHESTTAYPLNIEKKAFSNYLLLQKNQSVQNNGLNTIHLVLCSNENYADGMLVTVASALSSLNREASITVHLLDGGISEKTFRKLEHICKSLHPSAYLEIIKIDDQCFGKFKKGPGKSLMPYARLLIGSLFPRIDKVIYIDVDFLVLKDLQELWNMEMQGKIAWACRDIAIQCMEGESPLPISDDEKRLPYFNSGLLLLDLKKWRENDIENKSFEIALVNKTRFADQAILNYLFRGWVGFLDNEWNWQSPNVLLEGNVRIANYHFIWVKKPWMHLRTTLNYRLWRYYYRKYACGEIISLYRKIGLKRLLIGIRETLIRSHPFLRSLYLKSVAWKFGAASLNYSGMRNYYSVSTTEYPIDVEQKAFAGFIRHLKISLNKHD